MAKFDSKNLVSVRANKLVVGETYTMGVSKDAKTHSLVEFLGFFNANGERMENPKVLKAMDPTWTLRVTSFANGVTGEEVTLIKDPAGYGAIFMPAAKEGDKPLRVTFGADATLVERLKEEAAAARKAADEAKAAEKAAKAAEKAEEKAAAAAEEVTEEAPAAEVEEVTASVE